MSSVPGDERPDADGRRAPAAPEPLFTVLVRLSRAHWLIGSVASWLPPMARSHLEEASDLLDAAISDLRRYAARNQGTGTGGGPDEARD